MFSQGPLPLFFDKPSCHRPEPVTHPDQSSVPAITLDNGQVPRPLIYRSSGLDRRNTGNVFDLTQSDLGSNST